MLLYICSQFRERWFGDIRLLQKGLTMSTITLSVHQDVRHVGHHDVEHLRVSLQRHIEKGCSKSKGRRQHPRYQASLTTLGCERLVLSAHDNSRLVNIGFNPAYLCVFDSKGQRIQLAVKGYLNELAYLDMQHEVMTLTISKRLHEELFLKTAARNSAVIV